MSLRTRLALLLGALAAFTGVAVGVAGYRVTSIRFAGEIRASLDDFARELEQPDNLQALRACGTAAALPPDADGRPVRRRPGGRAGQPPGVIVQCLDPDAASTRRNPCVNLPVDDADVLLAAAWDRPYSRESAAFPDARLKQHKYWPPVSRVDNVHGDKHLICTCDPVSAYGG
jgi:hypothetical protein